MVTLSIVVAVYNEAGNIKPLTDHIKQAFLSSGVDYEVIFVDDGSDDGTVQKVRENLSENIILIELKMNSGQSAALKAGIDNASGEFIATMDGDHQNDPGDLLMMLNLIRTKDCDLVTGIRLKRQDGLFSKKIPSLLANYFLRKITRTKILDNGCAIKIFRSEVLKAIPLYGERHRFLATLALMEGASVEQVEVKHHPRMSGRSKYGMGRTMKVISDIILMSFLRKYRQKPMYLFGTIGFLTALSGSVILFILLIQKILGQDIWGRPLMILGVLLIIAGFQIISTGFILDIVIRKDYETNMASPYKIKRISQGK